MKNNSIRLVGVLVKFELLYTFYPKFRGESIDANVLLTSFYYFRLQNIREITSRHPVNIWRGKRLVIGCHTNSLMAMIESLPRLSESVCNVMGTNRNVPVHRIRDKMNLLNNLPNWNERNIVLIIPITSFFWFNETVRNTCPLQV